MRNLKALGLALVAIFAMSAMAASAASAEEGELTADTSPVVLDGNDIEGTVNAFTGLGQTISCASASYTGTVSVPTNEITATPTYENCIAGERAVTVTMNGCDYKFTDATGGGSTGGGHTWTVKSDLICTGTNKVEIHVYNGPGHTNTWCTLTIAAQNNLVGLKAVNETNGAGSSDDSIKLEGTVENIASQSHGTCSAGLTINFNGKLDTNVTVTGTDHEKEPNGIRID